MMPFVSSGSCHSSFTWKEPRSVTASDVTGPGTDTNTKAFETEQHDDRNAKSKRCWNAAESGGVSRKGGPTPNSNTNDRSCWTMIIPRNACQIVPPTLQVVRKTHQHSNSISKLSAAKHLRRSDRCKSTSLSRLFVNATMNAVKTGQQLPKLSYNEAQFFLISTSAATQLWFEIFT